MKTKKQREAARKIAKKFYYTRKLGRTRKETVSLIAKKVGCSRRYANKLYSDLDTADAVAYIEHLWSASQ